MQSLYKGLQLDESWTQVPDHTIPLSLPSKFVFSYFKHRKTLMGSTLLSYFYMNLPFVLAEKNKINICNL